MASLFLLRHGPLATHALDATIGKLSGEKFGVYDLRQNLQ
jgi:hypothetical protein